MVDDLRVDPFKLSTYHTSKRPTRKRELISNQVSQVGCLNGRRCSIYGPNGHMGSWVDLVIGKGGMNSLLDE